MVSVSDRYRNGIGSESNDDRIILAIGTGSESDENRIVLGIRIGSESDQKGFVLGFGIGSCWYRSQIGSDRIGR